MTYLILWSEKYQAEIECTDRRELLQTFDIQLNIYLKQETEIEFRKKPIANHRNKFKKIYGRPYNMVYIGRGTYSKLADIFKFYC